MKWHSERLFRPHNGFRVQGLANARHEPECGEIVRTRRRGPGLHQHADGGGRCVPDVYLFTVQRVIPAFNVEFRLVDDHRHPVRQGCHDAVGRAGHPAGVGGAPVNVCGTQIEGNAPGRMMGDHGLMDMHDALGLSGRSRGEMQKRGVLGAHALGREIVRRYLHGRV